MMNGKKKIFLFADWYEPGYKAGGPIRSCVNFVKHMQEYYQIYVFTSDRDLGSSTPYDNITPDQWNIAAVQSGTPPSDPQLYYCSPGQLTWKTIRRELETIKPDFIYINSMFSPKFAIFPLLIAGTSKWKSNIILSPRGMLRSSALHFKPLKKKLFLTLFRLSGFYKHISFQASDETEVQDIKHHFGPSVRVALIPNFPSAVAARVHTIQKEPGRLSLLFVGRVHPIKNLDFLLRVLQTMTAEIRLTIIGSLEDKQFWEKCKTAIEALPANISVQYAGEIPNHQLAPIIEGHHLFTLPTRGENFGHAIFESLALGRPVLISDQTPWRNLAAAKAGWDCPLDRPGSFRESLELAAGFGQEEYDLWCRSALQYVKDFIAQLNIKDQYRNLFS